MKAIIVDPTKHKIFLSSAFEHRAFTAGTSEYAQLMEVRRDFPGFSLVTRQFKTNTKQEHYRGLTYDFMREFIKKNESKEDAPKVIEGLDALIDISKGHSIGKRYPIVKKWFLDRYPKFAEFGMTEEQVQKYRDERIAPAGAATAETEKVIPLDPANQEIPA